LDFDFEFDFEILGKVSLTFSRDRSLSVDGLCSCTFLVFPIIINKVAV